ncbi:MAG: type 4 pilus major pilin [Alphaproteobacteria bacterium]|nr:type 4 pilus major pilin [Alphaproteobacteria bacterium]
MRAINHRARGQKGFTLTEISIVLGIMGLILGAIWTAASGVYDKQRVSHATTAIMQIVQGIRGIYASSSSLDADFNVTNLNNAGALPSDMVNSAGNALVGLFPGGATTLSSLYSGAAFDITVTKIPRDNCVSLLMAIAGNSRDPGLLAAASTAPAAQPAPLSVTATPVLAAAAVANNFGGCMSTSSNTMHFVFTLK